MIKKLLAFILAMFMLFSFVSCFDGTPETTYSPETTEAIPEEPVLRSFYSGQVLYSYDMSGDLYLTTQKGSEEYEKWERIYVDPDANADVLIYYEEGEIYEIFYSGEITPMAESQYGYVEKLHAIRIISSPREYDGIGYGVAILRQGFSENAIAPVSLAAEGKSSGGLMLLAESQDEFTETADSYFMLEREIPENATELQRKTITLMNQRQQLLDGYDNEFFNNNDLLMIFISSGSGSERYDIEDISIDSGLCNVTVKTTEPSLTCDMAYWIIFVSIPKEVSADITEYKCSVLPYEWESQDRQLLTNREFYVQLLTNHNFGCIIIS